MRRPTQSIFVDGRSYSVVERSGYIKADLQGILGWSSVWADDYISLVRRIRQARRGGQ